MLNRRNGPKRELGRSLASTFVVHVFANGNLLRAGHDPNNPYFSVGGQGGIVQEIAWDGTVVWEFVYSNRDHAQHHDIEPLPNGNVLLLAWERKTAQEAVMAGRDPRLIAGTGFWPEHLVEVRPLRPKGGDIVWEWHLWDHLIQERDPRLKNFGKVEEHPELVNINGDSGHRRESDEEIARLRALGYIVDSPQAGTRQGGGANRKSDWNHANSISYNPNPHFSPAFVARSARRRARWGFRPEGRGVVLDSTSSTPK